MQKSGQFGVGPGDPGRRGSQFCHRAASATAADSEHGHNVSSRDGQRSAVGLWVPHWQFISDSEVQVQPEYHDSDYDAVPPGPGTVRVGPRRARAVRRASDSLKA